MNVRFVLLLLFFLTGCNSGHPVKTDKIVQESALLGAWKYRNEVTIILAKNGIGVQLQEGMEHKINWRLTPDNHIELFAIRVNQADTDVKNFRFLISDDYREHFYFFGGFADFDNYEIWEKLENDNS